MKKFVIQYTTGMYDDFCEHVYTMEAETKEHIELWLLEAFEQYKLDFEKNKQFIQERSEAFHQNPIGKEFYDRYHQFLETRPFNLKVNGYYMVPPDDLLPEEELDEHLSLITISELDEWFENTKPMKKT